MNIYAVTIMGNMFYFYGRLSREDCMLIDSLCSQLQEHYLKEDIDTLYNIFLEMISLEIEKTVIKVQVKRIFRIK